YETISGKSIFAADTDWDYYDPYKDRDPRLQATVWLPVFGTGTYSDFRLGTNIPFDTRPGQSGNSPDYVNGSNVATATGFMLKKYLDPLDASNVNNGGINFINIRYADVLLMYAEAKIELDEIDASVVDAINAVRQRPSVNLPPITLLDQATMRDKVRHERMVELAMEGLRFYDIRRWKTAIDVMQGPIPGMVYLPFENEAAGPDTVIWQATVRIYTEADYEFPIPFRELELNPNLGK
ncbi:MAG: RagB/SusD family nutrient uptake outer membrane protein, partial [Saprospiraceae bacterium]|nr:RagB/SusD family nutrient uptake outer membrane protein [Saprospiraceae bacterium]